MTRYSYKITIYWQLYSCIQYILTVFWRFVQIIPSSIMWFAVDDLALSVYSVCTLYILLIYLYLLPTVFVDAPPCIRNTVYCILVLHLCITHTHTLFADTQLSPHSHNSFMLLFFVHICSTHVLCTVKFKITLIIRKWKFFFLFPISNLSLIKWQHLYTVYIYIM